MLGKGTWTSREVIIRSMGPMFATAPYMNVASTGDLPRKAHHKVNGMASNICSRSKARIILQVSLASVAAHMMARKLEGSAQSPVM